MSDPNVGSEYLTAGEAARMLTVSPKTVLRWTDAGRLPHVVTAQGHQRFSPAEAVEMARRMRPGD